MNACVGGCDTTKNDFNNIECHGKGVVAVYFPSSHHLYNSDDGGEIEVSPSHQKLCKNPYIRARVIAQIVPI